ncbi:TonB-dependent receptor [uncultured Sphingomonas sp.]|uniref:TonB-dependent receptor n=1 Tax=uncultured Sphingomonas sp. TaxID=158754 RepID=UPI0025E6EA48|nr:TonB-dependent receptor [uncultured Sphingomonas sp.]
MRIVSVLRATAAAMAIVVGHQQASAQAAEPAATSDAAAREGQGEEVLVTARLGTTTQRKVEASYSITTLNDQELRQRAIGNLAEAMQQIPGVWADSSAGVTANNIRVRGIPRGGYESLAVYEDGLPIQHDPGINWINVDQFLRIDESYASIEAVRGGPSSIFAANAPGGLINFIPRKGTPELSGIVKLTTADYGQIRGDVWFGGPLGDGWRFSAGGFYNKDKGVRDPGPTANNGGQGRVLISKDFARGSLSFGIKYMEDNNFFFDATPLVRSGNKLRPLEPFNGHDDTLTGREDGLVRIKTPRGQRRADFNLFNQSSDLQLTAKGNIEFDDGTTLSGGLRYRDSNTDRNARGLNNLSTQAAYLSGVRTNALRAFAGQGATDVRLVYATDGSAYPADANGNGLVGVNTFQSIQNPISETIGLVELGHVFDTGIGRHDVKLGVYGTSADWAHDRNDGVGITEVAPNARLLDVVAVNAAGRVVGRVTDNGIARYESRFAHSFGGYEDVAAHISDEWQVTSKLRLDGGFRYEKIWLHGYSEGVRSPPYNLGDPTTLADDNVLFGSGVYNRFKPPFDDYAYTFGANWQFMPEAGIFARYTNTYRLPMIGQYRDNVLPTGIRSQSIEQAEGGVKFMKDWGSLYATVFYNSFKDVQFTNTYIDPQSLLIVQEINYGDVRTVGLELEANVRPTNWFDVSATATYQDPKFKNYTYNTQVNGALVAVSFDDNRPSSMPKVMTSVRPRLTLLQGRLRVLGEWRFEGTKYNDDANLVKLPSFSVFNASAEFDITPALTVQVKGSNLSNSLGLGQGGGQQQVPGAADGAVVLARPIFGRAVQGSVLFHF